MLESHSILFDPFISPSIQLSSRIVMAPLTRSRATQEHTPAELMATYYGQRATAGLIISEGTSPSPNGLGYPRIPGLFNEVQVQAWKASTTAVHEQEGKVFVQLMHCGRVAHLANLPKGAEVLSSSNLACPGEMFTDSMGSQAHSAPRAMTTTDIALTIEEYVASVRYAIDAGFDGVELHAANGYLIEQFLNPLINTRSDGYGGGIAERNRFAVEIAKATIAAIGKDRIGIRLSPYGVFNGIGEFPEVQEQYLALADSLSKLGVLYIHLVDHSSMGATVVPADFKQKLREKFKGISIVSGGFDRENAEQALLENRGDLVAFGRPFLANPDLVARMRDDLPMNVPDPATFYIPGAHGYTDYPVFAR